jgi:hypothetical protein
MNVVWMTQWREQRKLQRARTGDTPEKLAEDERKSREPQGEGDVAATANRVSGSMVVTSASHQG